MHSIAHTRYTYLFIVISLLLYMSCIPQKSSETSKNSNNKQEKIYAIKNVTVIPMTANNTSIKNATVIIRDHKIDAINTSIPKNATIIDGTGKWLIPGLIDMHVHNLSDGKLSNTYPTKGITHNIDNQDFMLLYLANGVTTAFELTARVEHFGQRNEISKGNVIGPRIALAFLIDDNGSLSSANTPETGRQTVRIAKAQGYEFIKVYTRLNIPTYKAIIDEAQKLNMKVIGHIPMAFKGKTKEAFVPNFGMIAHAEELSKQTDTYTYEKAQEFAQLAKQNGTWLTPNMSNMVWIIDQARSLDCIRNSPNFKYIHPLMQSKWLYSNNYRSRTKLIPYFQKQLDFHKLIVKAFKEAGVPMVAGTDAGTSGIIWGFSLHDELQLMVDAGLTPEETLQAATRLPATWLGIANKVGTIEEGKLADLILLEKNPLEDIRNTQKISGVFANGKWVDKIIIDRMLDDLAKRNTNNLHKDKYNWKKRRSF